MNLDERDLASHIQNLVNTFGRDRIIRLAEEAKDYPDKPVEIKNYKFEGANTLGLRRQKTSPDSRTWAAGAYSRAFREDGTFKGLGVYPDSSTNDSDLRRANTEKSALEMRKEIVANQFLEREAEKQ